MTNTFIFSNMAPQHDRFNRGIWARLEDRVRRWAIVADGVYVVTGSVFDRNDDGQRDADADAELMANRVGIPSHVIGPLKIAQSISASRQLGV